MLTDTLELKGSKKMTPKSNKIGVFLVNLYRKVKIKALNR